MVALNGSLCSHWDGGKCHRGHRHAKWANSTGSFLNDPPHGKGQEVAFILTGGETSELRNMSQSLWRTEKQAFSYLTGRSFFTINCLLALGTSEFLSPLFKMIDVCLRMFAVCFACHWGY